MFLQRAITFVIRFLIFAASTCTSVKVRFLLSLTIVGPTVNVWHIENITVGTDEQEFAFDPVELKDKGQGQLTHPYFISYIVTKAVYIY